LVQISWQEVRIQPPANGAVLSKTEVKAWVIRVWEPESPQGREELEWILVTTMPVMNQENAWERVKWYKWRWRMSDFHKVLKTGCRIARPLQTDGRGHVESVRDLDPDGAALIMAAADSAAGPGDPSQASWFHKK
jgi:hypothetical protein